MSTTISGRQDLKTMSTSSPASAPSAETKTEAAVATQTKPSPTAMDRQPTLNVGTLGHVAHGKSTLVRALTGVSTGKSSQEIRRNMTIQLGYTNAKIWCCSQKCSAPQCYTSTAGTVMTAPPCPAGCGAPTQLKQHISFVDSPGHHELMSTMLSGAAVMDAAVLVIAANEPCPSPQTQEHLVAAEVMGIARRIVTLQNKLDLVTREDATQHHVAIKQFLGGTGAENNPIVPIVAQRGVNTDVLCEILAHLPQPPRDLDSPPQLLVIRSFDVNKPGCAANQLRGGVVGGSLLRGQLVKGDEVEIRPGISQKDPKTGKLSVTPLRTKVVSLESNKQKLEQAVPGGLISLGLDLDPFLCKSDRLVGSVVGAPGSLPPVFTKAKVSYSLLKEVVKAVEEDPNPKPRPEEDPFVSDSDEDDDTASVHSHNSSSKKSQKVKGIRKGDILLFCVGSAHVQGTVEATDRKSHLMKVCFDEPVCASPGAQVSLFRDTSASRGSVYRASSSRKHWRLIGCGAVKAVQELELSLPSSVTNVEEKTVEKVVLDEDDDISEELFDESDAAELKSSGLPAVPEDASKPQDDEKHTDKQEEEVDSVEHVAQLKEWRAEFDENCTHHNTGALPMSAPCYFYDSELPDRDELVMVHIERVDPQTGVHGSLPEYCDAEVFMALQQVSRTRYRSLKKLVRKGQNMVCMILRRQGTTIDISLKHVQGDEKESHSLWYRQSATLNSILQRVASTQRVPLRVLCELFAWPLYEQCAEDDEEKESTQRTHPVDICRDIAAFVGKNELDAAHALLPEATRSQLPPSVRRALLTNIAHRLPPKPLKIAACVKLVCAESNGVKLLKNLVKAGMKAVASRQKVLNRERMAAGLVMPGDKVPSDEDRTVQVTVTSPKYYATMVSRDRSAALELVATFVHTVKKLVLQQQKQGKGCMLHVVAEPQVETSR